MSSLSYGDWWIKGKLEKPLFENPTIMLYLRNAKRIILENQDKALRTVAANEGYLYSPLAKPNECLVPFDKRSVNFGIWRDPNDHALYITGRINSLFITNSKRESLELKITATTGAQQDVETGYIFATAYLTAIQSIFESMHPDELVQGWRGKTKPPKIQLPGANDLVPTIMALNTELGATPELTINYNIHFHTNRIKNR